LKPVYSIETDALTARDAASGELLWRNDFGGYRVSQLLTLAAENGCLVLLDPSSSQQPTFENLLRVTDQGEVAWTAALPQRHDTFVELTFTSAGVEANTWTGLRLRIDLTDGSSHEIRFTK